MSDVSPHTRKQRTRQHVIADLAVNHVERQILLAGHTCEAFRYDYGLDLTVYFYSEGRVTNGHVVVQVKASDTPRYLRTQPVVSFAPSMEDLEHWAGEWVPVFLVVYDADRDVAYWREITSVDRGSRRPLHLPMDQVLDRTAVKQWHRRRDEVASPINRKPDTIF
ncbi:MAG: DUF4365 domain-containing protein [Planctomycetota bacterium]